MSAEGAHIDFDLDIIVGGVFDVDLLRELIAGHNALEVFKKVGGGIIAAGGEDELLRLTLIGDRGIGQRGGSEAQAERQNHD